MEYKQANEILEEYGKILQNKTEIVFSEENLPAEKESIKSAIKVIMAAYYFNGKLTEDIRNGLEFSYTELGSFVSPEIFEKMNSINHLADGRFDISKDTESLDESIEISKEVIKISEGLMSEMRLFEIELLSHKQGKL